MALQRRLRRTATRWAGSTSVCHQCHRTSHSFTTTSRRCSPTCTGCGSLNAPSTNFLYWSSTACMGPRRVIYKRSFVRSRTSSHDVACALPPRQTWPCRLRDVQHWATALLPWPVRVLGTLCLRRSVGVHHLTLLNAHWKPIYTSSVISNSILWHLYSVLEVFFYLRHFKLNCLHYITLQRKSKALQQLDCVEHTMHQYAVFWVSSFAR